MKQNTAKATQKFNEVDELIHQSIETMFSNIDNPAQIKKVFNYLKGVGQLNNYSEKNIKRIMSQLQKIGLKTYPKLVHSYSKWKEMNVQVQKGSLSLKIYVPKKKYKIKKDSDGKPIKKGKYWDYEKDKDGKKISDGYIFVDGNVFDVSQTDGIEKGIISTGRIELKQGRDISISMLNEFVKEIYNKFNIAIYFKDFNNRDCGGYCILNKNSIVINNGNHRPNKYMLSVLFHELGHALLHGNDDYESIHLSKGIKEGEAESVSYILCSKLGIEQEGELYLKSWGNDREILEKQLDRIIGAAKDVFSKIDFDKIIEDELNRRPKLNLQKVA